MDFLIQNYIWLIVIGVFILMVVIGYFADKKQNSNNEKKLKLKDHVDELDANETTEPEVDIAEWGEKPVPKEEDEVIEVKGLDTSFDSWDENIEGDTEESKEAEKENSIELPETEENKEENTENTEVTENKDETVETAEETEESEEKAESVEPTEEVEEIEETENKEEEKEVIPEETIAEEENESALEDLEITLPNMDTLNEEIKDVVDADDVWKF